MEVLVQEQLGQMTLWRKDNIWTGSRRMSRISLCRDGMCVLGAMTKGRKIIMYGRKTSHEHEYRLGYWLWQSFDCVDYNKLWKILQEMGIPDNLTCLLRNLYAGQEVTVRERERESYVCVCVCVCVYTYTSLHIATCLFNL